MFIIDMKRYCCTLLALIGLASLGVAQTGTGLGAGGVSGDGQSRGTESASDCINNPMLPGCEGAGGSGESRTPSIEVQHPGIQRYDQREPVVEPEAKTQADTLPSPPTEFQRFVAESTGVQLPIFGNRLFQNVPSTFAPVSGIPVASDYVLGPDDELNIRSWGQLNVQLLTTIDRSGQIYFPKVGSITLAGVKFSDVVPLLKAEVGKFYKNFDLTVSMGHLRSIQIFVVGQAVRPGSYTISSLSTLLNALFASGGPNSQGSLRDIQLKRDGKVVTDFDLYEFLLKGDKSKDVNLQAGDVIFIPPVGPVVAITGSVQTPAVYELKGSTTLGDALTLVGGLSTVADAQKAMVERIDEHRVRQMQEFPLDQEGLSRVLKDGDIVQVISIVPKFENAVTIRGNVANPGRYSWREGMRLRDLIPNREFLLTREYWRNQNLMGGRFPPPSEGGTWGQPGQTTASTARQRTQLQQPQQQQLPAPAPAGAAAPRSVPGSQSLGAASVASEQGTGDQTLQTRPESNMTGSQLGRVTLAPRGAEGITFDIKRSAPDINWDYAVIQRLNPDDLSTRLLPFNLGRLLLDNDDSQNLALRAGDVVTVFSQRDLSVPMARRTKFVRLEGEVHSPGVYKVEAGDTLQTMVQRAGGLTSGAYLYGSDFTRESLRQEQQRGLDVTIRSTEIELASHGVAGSALVDKLRQLRATGRMVLELRASDTALDALPALALEDGDRLAIPNRPSTVNVIGAVYNQNSYIFRSGKRVGDYLRLAGQGTREADRKHMFLMRADGSVITATRSSGMWGGGFASLYVLPGDIIVVPLKVMTGERLKNLQAWSQLFSQFAIGAASLAVVTGH